MSRYDNERNEFDGEQPTVVSEVLAEASVGGVDVAEAYRVTTIVPYAEKPHETNTYDLLPQDLDQFFHDYSVTAEIVVDIRPMEGADGE